MSQIIKYALNLVFRRKLRTLLTSLGITISVILLSFIIFGMKGLENALINEFTSRFDPNEITVFNDSRINAFASGMSQEDGRKKEKKYEVMNEEVVELIKNTQKAESVQPIIMIMTFDIYIDGIDDPYLDNNVVGMDSKGDDNFFVEYTKVSIDSDKYLDSENVYISKMLLDYYDLSADELRDRKIVLKPTRNSLNVAPSKTLSGKTYELKVGGIIDSGQDRMSLVMSLDNAEKILADIGGYDSKESVIKEYGYTQLIVEAKEGQVDELKKYIDEELGFTAFTAQDFLSFIKTLTNGLTLALVLFGVVSCFVASIGIVNTMVMSIYEQTREIGIIKAIGANNFQVLAIFLMQSMVIGLIGGVLGVGFVLIVAHFVDPIIVEQLNQQGFTLTHFFSIEPITVASIVFASIVVGIVAGIYPSVRASRLDPVKALRYE